MPTTLPKPLKDEYNTRLDKLKRIREQGINPFPEKFEKLQSVAEVLKLNIGKKVKTAGRLLTIREMGKICFCHIQDSTDRIPIVLKKDDLDMKQFLKLFFRADFLGL